jgi:hypothetical protein
MAAVEALLAVRSPMESHLSASLLRYGAAAGTFCPMMAVLGAKRPQDRGWQWVVAALWVTLLVPAGQALAAPAGQRLELFAAWRFMVWGLIVVGLLNYIPTRNAVAALLAAMGQACFFASYVVDAAPGKAPQRVAVGLALMLVAIVVVLRFRALPERRVVEAKDSLAPFDARWRSFRDAWGAFWALRIQNRVNESAGLGRWPVRLEWHGFAPSERGDGVEAHDFVASQIEQTLDSLLRRFERAIGGSRL